MKLSRILCGSVALGFMLAAHASFAESFPMTGNLNIRPAGFAANRDADRPRPGATTLDTVNQTGVAPRSITMPANLWSITGSQFRLFPTLPNVAQITSNFTDTHASVMFSAGGGPPAIAWCPKITGCLTFTSGTVAPILLQITPGSSQFGGTFKLARSTTGSFVRVPDPPPPPVTIAIQPVQDPPQWAAGATSFVALNIPAPPAKIYQSPILGPSGSVLSVGAFVSTAAPAPNALITGFGMGTGRIFLIDATPATTMGGPFSSSTTGTDQRTASGNGNIVLVGGSVAYAGSAGTNFGRFNRLTLNLPEPTSGVGVAVGALALFGLWRSRKSK
jgi:hypothetical protein